MECIYSYCSNRLLDGMEYLTVFDHISRPQVKGSTLQLREIQLLIILQTDSARVHMTPLLFPTDPLIAGF